MSNGGGALLGFPVGRSVGSRLFGWPLRMGSATRTPVFEVAGAVEASSVPTAITASVSTNVKGSYSEVIAATSFKSAGFLFQNLCTTATADYLLDIAIGPVGGETVIVSDLLISSQSVGNLVVQIALFPIAIPAGSRISARCQSSDASAALNIVLQLIKGGVFQAMGLTRCSSYGPDTSDSGAQVVDPGAVANTKGAWTQIVAATDPIEWAVIALGNRNNAVQAISNNLLDIGIGSPGSEQALITDLYYRCHTTGDCFDPVLTALPLRIPAGSRLAARCQSTTTDATDRLVDVAVYGVW